MKKLFSVLLIVALVSNVLWGQENSRSSNENDVVKLEENANAAIQKIEKLRKDFGKLDNVLIDPKEMRDKYMMLLDEEKYYLDKLIELDEFNPKYKFNLANNLLRRGDSREKGIEMMQQLASKGAPDLIDPHLVLLQIYMTEAARKNDSTFKDKARKHLDRALNIDPKNFKAKEFQAYFSALDRDFSTAVKLYSELSKNDPKYFVDVAKYSQYDENKEATARTLSHFKTLVDAENSDPKQFADGLLWAVNIHRNYKLDEGIRWLDNVLARQTEESKKILIRTQLARLYATRARSYGRDASGSNVSAQLKDLNSAFELAPKDEVVRQWLTILGLRDDEVGNKARQTYDPQKDRTPGWASLSELALDQLSKERYDDAIRFFERARKKNPSDSTVLNNLAYTYLKKDNPNPEQALILVDKAITLLTKSKNAPNKKMVLVSFFDTRAEALLQMSRYRDSAAAYEYVLKHRENDAPTIKKLIESYKNFDDDKVEEYEELLKKLNDNR